MKEYIFLFDLDSTITRQEILPTVAGKLGFGKEMARLTESAMSGRIPFKESFLQRVNCLRSIPVSEISQAVGEISLNIPLVDFMQRHQDRCYIVTGNLDVWIEKLIEKIGMQENTFCSKAIVKNDRIENVLSVINKNAIISQLVLPYVAVGDGHNDAEMIENADVGIGYGGVRKIADSVLACASHAIYEEEKLVWFLERLI